MGESARIVGLYRYPVKGLSPEALAEVQLEAGGTFPNDRAFAIENGKHEFDPAAPKHFPKIKFLVHDFGGFLRQTVWRLPLV